MNRTGEDYEEGSGEFTKSSDTDAPTDGDTSTDDTSVNDTPTAGFLNPLGAGGPLGPGSKSVDELIARIRRAMRFISGVQKIPCICTLNISGHGTTGLAGCAFDGTDKGWSQSLTYQSPEEQLRTLGSYVCEDGVINLCCCVSAGNPAGNYAQLQILANKLARTVCGCGLLDNSIPGRNTDVHHGCKCKGDWICKAPSKSR